MQKCKSAKVGSGVERGGNCVEQVGSGVEFHFSLRATRDWKVERVTDLGTYGHG